MNEIIGNLIKEHREQLNITSAELAKKVGVSQATISNIENGKFGKRTSSLNIINDIISVLDINIDNKEITDYIKTNNDDENNESSDNKLKKEVDISFTAGKCTEVFINISTKIPKEIEIKNLTPDEKESLKYNHMFETNVIVKTLVNFLTENEKKINSLIIDNLNLELEKMRKSYETLLEQNKE